MLPAACLLAPAACVLADPPRLSLSYLIWNWTEDGRNFDRFRERVAQGKAAGCDTIEATIGWRDVETVDGVFDFTEADRRIEEVGRQGLKLRVRLNFTYLANWPAWHAPALMTGLNGETPTHVLSPFDEKTNDLRDRFTEAVARHFRGRGIVWVAGLGMHLEVKYGAWISYEPPARAAFRRWLGDRYGKVAALNGEAGTSYKSFEEVEPPEMKPTEEVPDLDPLRLLFLQFREDGLARQADRFAESIRRGDPGGRVAVMLGESWRREGAAFANQAYWRYARLADEVLHSYDFYMNPHDDPLPARRAVQFFRGMTAKPVSFEIDGPFMFDHLKWKYDQVLPVAWAAVAGGAGGFNLANYETDPANFPFVKPLAELTQSSAPPKEAPSSERLFYVSKWTFYTLRQKDESLRARVYKHLAAVEAKHGPFRVVSDENLLTEPDLKPEVLAVSYSPVRSAGSQKALERLAAGAKAVEVDGPGLKEWKESPVDLDYGIR